MFDRDDWREKIVEQICFMENTNSLSCINTSEETLPYQYKCEQYWRNIRINYTMKIRSKKIN